MAHFDAEYDDPRTDSRHSVEVARLVFLELVERMAPEVLEDLRADVLPLADPSPALERWGERWNLADPWLLEDARSTVETWKRFPQTLDHDPLRFHPDRFGGMVLEAPPLEVRWEVTREKWDQFTDHVERELRQYREDVKAWAEENGLERAPEKRARRGSSPDLHFRWLVRFQLGETQGSIARDPEGTGRAVAYRDQIAVRTVRDALYATAPLVGLTLRTATPE